MTRSLDYKAIGQHLRDLIESSPRYGTLTAFGLEVKYKKSSISEFCSGQLPFLDNIQKFCDKLDCDVEQLLCLETERITQAQIDLARADGLCRGLLYRNNFFTVFKEASTQKYWGTLITKNRILLDVMDNEWETFIKPLLSMLIENEEMYSIVDEDYVNIVLQVCHYLSCRMDFNERIVLAQLAQKKAARLCEKTKDLTRKRNMLAAQLILAADGECFARIEIGDVKGLPYKLAEVESIARKSDLQYLAKFAHIVRARALLYEEVASATTLAKRTVVMKENALKARGELKKIQAPDWTSDYLIANRYYAVRAEIALAEQCFDDAILLYSRMLEHDRPEIELNVGTRCSLVHAHVMKAFVNTGSIQENETREAKRLRSTNQSDKLLGEDLLDKISDIYLLLLDKKKGEALDLAQKTRGDFVMIHGVQENHNLIRVLDMLIQDLNAGNPLF